MAEAQPLKTKGVPVDSLTIQELWNDRRDPHANPLSSEPRRSYSRAPKVGDLGGMIDQIYRSHPTHTAGDE